MAEEELKIPIGIPVETNADQAAGSIEDLRQQILGGTEQIRAMAGTLRQLRGSTDEVKAAKAQLTTKLESLKDRVGASTLALVKQGTTYDAVASKTKKMADEQKKMGETMGNAIGRAGGPVAALRGHFADLKSIVGETGGVMGVATFAAAGLVTVIAALAAGTVAATVSLGKFILSSANAARSANLQREAWSGTAQNASNLGTQINALSNKVATGKAALNELAISLMKQKIGGQATVDTFNAVAQASAALGDEAGKKIEDFITRSRMIGRVRIDPYEMLEGFGNLNFDDIAKSLADGMHVSVDAARKALREGRVKLGDGAKAMRDAVEKKFGELNVRKMLDLNVMAEKLHEKLAGLTDGVKLEPLLKPLGELGKLLDENTVTGQQLKMLVTAFGTGMVSALQKGIPVAKAFFQGMIIGSLELYIGFLKVRNQLRDTFGGDTLKNVDTLKIALDAGKTAAVVLAASVVAVGAAIAAIAAPAALAYEALIDGPQKAGKAIGDFFKNTDWASLGTRITDGIASGIRAGAASVVETVKGLGETIKKAFTGKMEIRSPSKVMFRLGKELPAGTEGGVRAGTPGVAKAVDDMASPPAMGGRGGGSAGGGSAGGLVVHLHIHAEGGSKAEQVAAAVTEPSILALLTKALQEALAAQGAPVFE